MARRQGTAQEDRLADEVVVAEGLPEPLRLEFAELGLSPYELQLLLALLRLGEANTLELARVTNVPRTSCYQVLESLAAKRLASRIPGGRVQVWCAAEQNDIFERLESALESTHAERVRQHRLHAGRAKSLLAAWVPEGRTTRQPYVHTLTSPSKVKQAYDGMLAEAEHELLMFTRPPYVVVPGQAKTPVLDMLARGVEARVLYQADKWEEPEAHAARQELDAYHEAGVQGRLVDHLPIKLVLVDSRVALVGMTDPVAPEAGYPIALLIEHPGFVAIQRSAFEHMWADSRPLTLMPAPAAGGVPPELADLADRVDRDEQ